MNENFIVRQQLTAFLRALESLDMLGETETQELRQICKALEDYIFFLMNNGQVPQQQPLLNRKLVLGSTKNQEDYQNLEKRFETFFNCTCPICKGSYNSSRKSR
jgi:hypothetical protein